MGKQKNVRAHRGSLEDPIQSVVNMISTSIPLTKTLERSWERDSLCAREEKEVINSQQSLPYNDL